MVAIRLFTIVSLLAHIHLFARAEIDNEIPSCGTDHLYHFYGRNFNHVIARNLENQGSKSPSFYHQDRDDNHSEYLLRVEENFEHLTRQMQRYYKQRMRQGRRGGVVRGVEYYPPHPLPDEICDHLYVATLLGTQEGLERQDFLAQFSDDFLESVMIAGDLMLEVPDFELTKEKQDMTLPRHERLKRFQSRLDIALAAEIIEDCSYHPTCLENLSLLFQDRPYLMGNEVLTMVCQRSGHPTNHILSAKITTQRGNPQSEYDPNFFNQSQLAAFFSEQFFQIVRRRDSRFIFNYGLTDPQQSNQERLLEEDEELPIASRNLVSLFKHFEGTQLENTIYQMAAAKVSESWMNPSSLFLGPPENVINFACDKQDHFIYVELSRDLILPSDSPTPTDFNHPHSTTEG